MILKAPFEISARLLPALGVDDGWLQLEFDRVEDGRAVFRWTIDIPAGEFSGADLGSGVGGCGYQLAFGSLLAFLGAAAESYAYRQRTGRSGENEDLFPPAVVEWAHQHSDELSTLQAEIEETEGLITGDRDKALHRGGD